MTTFQLAVGQTDGVVPRRDATPPPADDFAPTTSAVFHSPHRGIETLTSIARKGDSTENAGELHPAARTMAEDMVIRLRNADMKHGALHASKSGYCIYRNKMPASRFPARVLLNVIGSTGPVYCVPVEVEGQAHNHTAHQARLLPVIV
ncbi:hypothetical protein WI666_01665 [Vibrio cholerae]